MHGLMREGRREPVLYSTRGFVNQNQPLGNSRFHAKIEATIGKRREAKPRGRPRVQCDESPARAAGQGEPGL